MLSIARFKLLCVIVMLVVAFSAIAAELPTEPILRIEPSEHTAAIKGIASDSQGRWLVTSSKDKTARVWDLSNGHLLNTLRIPIGSGEDGQLHAVALSPDGQIVALGGHTLTGDSSASIFLLDRISGRLLRRLTDLPDVIHHLAFSPDGKVLAATLGAGRGLRLFSITDGRLLAEDSDYFGNSSSYSVDFSTSKHADGHLVVTSYEGYLLLYRFDGLQLTLLAKRAAPGGKKPQIARFSPDGNHIAVGFMDTPAVNVLHAADLSFDYAPDTAGVDASLNSVDWSRQGNYLYAGGAAQAKSERGWQFYIRRWSNSGKGTPVVWPVAGNTLIRVAALSNGRLVFGSLEPSWGMVNAQGQRIFFHAPVIANFSSNLKGFSLSTDGAQVRFGYENHGKSPVVFDSQHRAFVAEQALNAPILAAPGLNVTDWEDTTAPKLNGTPLKLDTYEISRCLALLPDGSSFALGTEWHLRLFNRDGTQRWQQAAPGVVWAVNVSQDGRWVVAAYGDGTIRWHRASDGVEQLAFFPHADKKRWVMWTPSGYYDASPGAEDLIGWHLNRGKNHEADFFPASRFRERFYRPDVLTKVLSTQDEVEAVRLANVESGRRTQAVTSIAQVLPPVVEIVSPVGDSTVQSGIIKVRYRVRTAADAPVTAMRVRVNGLLQSDTRALKRVAENNDDDVKEIEVTIPEAGIQSATRALKRTGKGQENSAASSSQDVEIQLFAENKFSTSTPAILRLQLTGGKATTKQTASGKPKLYVLAVGVSKYANPEYNLGLASKDANDFVNSLKGQKGKLYSDVVVKLLTDDKATKDDVLDGLDWLKQNVTANDVGVMFVAGHGMNDKLGGYYFMPHNADPDKLARTGVSQADIKQTFANLPGHTVFFIDTCYSGGVMGNVRTSGFVNDLASAENGAVVFTASSSGQESLENSTWGNGAFTKSVVEGLSGKADAFNSGAVTVKGLDFYVDGRVKSLTNGQQTPVSISPGGLSDFPIAGVGR